MGNLDIAWQLRSANRDFGPALSLFFSSVRIGTLACLMVGCSFLRLELRIGHIFNGLVGGEGLL